MGINMAGIQRICGDLKQLGITACILLVICLVPLYMQDGYYRLGTAKCLLYRNVSMVLLPAVFFFWMVSGYLKRPKGGTVKAAIWQNHKWTGMDLLAAAYGCTVLLSFLLSDYKEAALYGANGWYMGLYSQISFLCLYFLCAHAWQYEKEVLTVGLVTAGGIAFLAILNRFGIYPVKLGGSSPTVLSTIGNINWLSGYLSLMMPVSLAFFWGMGGSIKRAGTGLLSAVFIICCFVQGSESGYLALAASLFGLLLLPRCGRDRIKAFGQAVLITAGSFCTVTFINDCFPGRLTYENWLGKYYHIRYGLIALLAAGLLYAAIVFCQQCKKESHKRVYLSLLAAVILLMAVFGYRLLRQEEFFASLILFDDAWGNGRGNIWKTCFTLWREEGMRRKLFGVGPDALAAFAYGEHAGNPLFAVIYKDSILTNCHNEWLTVLLNLGLFGLFAYCGFLLASVKRLIRSRDLPVLAAVLGILVYSVHNLVSFQQITNTPILFVLLGIAAGREKGR